MRALAIVCAAAAFAVAGCDQADPADPCAGLGETECAAAPGCRAVRAHPSGADGHFAGCVSDRGCETARLTLVEPQSGDCVGVATTCLPSGWDTSATCGAAGQPCEGLDEATCDADPWCAPIHGSAATGAGGYAGCWTGVTPEGGFVPCGQAVTTCRHPETGVAWTFSSTCIPDGWDPSTCGDP